MRFEFHNSIVHHYLIWSEVIVWSALVLISLIIGPWIVTLAIGIMIVLLFVGVNYVVDVVIGYPWELPIIYEIEKKILVINYKNFWERKIDLDSVLMLKFRNHKYRKSLYIEFKNDEGRKMAQKTTATFNKAWPQDKWQELFEELRKRCPDAKIVIK